MYIKRIEINGFKSFARPAELIFDGPKNGGNSITAIVGPNGSGKSNIADAIRWVLGEQSLKQLRGKKSEDVIFAGSEGKGKMSMASVELTLDNTDNRAEIDMEELVLARRVYRDGQSQYLVGGRTVRLLDLQILLAKAQFGHGSYSVIGQGMVDELLLTGPDERKNFFDEAVGIKEFQLKRHHAMLKLSRTRENMAQAELLLNEITPRLRLLKRQVNKLQERQEVERQLREMQERYYCTLYTDLAARIAQTGAAHDEAAAVYGQNAERLEEIQRELAELLTGKHGADTFAELQRAYQESLGVRREHEKNLAVLQGKLHGEYHKEGKQSLAWAEEKLSALNSTAADAAGEAEAECAALVREEDALASLTASRTGAEAKRAAALSERTRLETRVRELRAGEDSFSLEGLRAVEAVIRNRSSFSGTVYGTVAELAEVDEEFRIALEVAAASHMASIVVENDITAEACIAHLKRERLGFATFLPLNTIRPRMVQKDIAALAGKTGVYGLAIDLVRFDGMFQDVFSYVFGSTLVLDTIETARKVGIGRVRMVTLEGDILETSGSMKGGYRKMGTRGLHFSTTQKDGWSLARLEECERELSSVLAALTESELALQKLSAEHAQADTAVRVRRAKIELLDGRVKDLSREISALAQEQKSANMSRAEYGEMVDGLRKERTALEKTIADASRRVHELEKNMQEHAREEERNKERVFSLQGRMLEEQAECGRLSDKRTAAQMELVKLETHAEDLEREMYDALKVSGHSLSERRVPCESIERAEELKQAVEKMKYTLSLIGGIDEEVVREYEETHEKHGRLSGELNDLTEAYADLETLVAELDTIMKKRYRESFSKIRKEFARYFGILFDGGRADLEEVYEEENDNAEDGVEAEEAVEAAEKKRGRKLLKGIEVYACPPGKKIKNIQALSGGERTLTSLALVCAILHVNPPPFVLLDEVEAALDESNTRRFTKILRELTTQSQFIIITHNRVTMHAADVLYGVTMGASGMSELVSVKLADKVYAE